MSLAIKCSFGAAVVVTAIACAPSAPKHEDTSTPTASDTSALDKMKWHFSPSREQKQWLAAGLDSVRRKASLPLDLSFGQPELYQLTTGGDGRKYLLLAYVADSSRARMAWGWTLLVVYDSAGTLALSAPYSFGDEENVVIVSVADIDGDAYEDVVYCSWYEAQGGRISPRGLGYRELRWYPIRVEGALSRCEDGGGNH